MGMIRKRPIQRIRWMKNGSLLKKEVPVLKAIVI
jgi:hypothetical protein